MNFRLGSFGATALIITGAHSLAGVTDYSVAKLHTYSQNAPSQPGAAQSYRFTASVDTLPGDANAVSVNGTALIAKGDGSWDFAASYASQAALDSAFPGSITYNLHLQGGALGSRDEAVSLPNPEAYPSVPALTPASFLAAQSAIASQGLLLEWTAPNSAANLVGLSVYSTVNGSGIVDEFLPISQTSYLVAPGLLVPNHSYQIDLFFGNADSFTGQPGPSGFGLGASGISAFVSETGILFQTSADPPCIDVGGYGLIKGALYSQTDTNQPTQAEGYVFFAFVDTPSGSAFGAASLVINGNQPGQVLLHDGSGAWGLEEEYVGPGAKASLDADYPSLAGYTLQGNSGSLGARSENLLLGSDAYPSVPYLVGTSYADLQGMNPGQPRIIQWSAASGGTSDIYVEVTDVLADVSIFEATFPGTATSYEIPAGTLQAGRAYELQLGFNNVFLVVGEPCPGFGVQSEEIAIFLSNTEVAFMAGGTFEAYCFGDGSGAICPCSGLGGIGEGCANTTGSGATLDGTGNVSFSNDTLMFLVGGVPGSKPGLLLRADNQAAIPAGDGILCAVGGSQRSQIQVTSGGSTTFTNFNGSTFSLVSNGVGVPTNFQFWYRDPSNPCSGAGFNLTNALSVTYGF